MLVRGQTIASLYVAPFALKGAILPVAYRDAMSAQSQMHTEFFRE